MKRKYLGIIALLLLIGVKFSLTATENYYSQSFEIDSTNIVDGKIYITDDQVVVSDVGMYLLLEDVYGILQKIFVSQINFDENGLFVHSDYLFSPQVIERCPKGHPLSCPKCFRCKVPRCPYRCKGH